jgi:hypothetical protein
MCSTFQPFRRQPPLTPWHRFDTLPLSLPGLQDLLVPVWASPSVGRLAALQAESRSSSCGLVVRLPLLLTPPCGDAITVDYRPESACLKWTSTTPIAHTYGRTDSRSEGTARAPCAAPAVVPRCGSSSEPAAARKRCERPVITDPQQISRILLHLIKTGAAPPGLDAASLG